MIAGIDYGSKMAGTTAICLLVGDHLEIFQSEKKKDADGFLAETLENHHFSGQIFIDAPLSLPLAYYENPDHPDFFYRKCDRETGAMSPMFLGGLTARAIQLSHTLSKEDYHLYESYPGGLAKLLALDEMGYKGKKESIVPIVRKLESEFEIMLKEIPLNWHQVDSLLCYIIGMRFHAGKVKAIGDPEEGLILI